MDSITLKLPGVAPLLMHNGQTADPLNKFAKAMKQISGKRSKTEADLMELAKLEYLAGLYLNSDGQVCIPDYVLEATLIAGAKKVKSGPAAKAGLFVGDGIEFNYGETLTPEGLWDSERFVNKARVRVSQAAVMRYRPMFKQWTVTAKVEFNNELLNGKQILEFARHAGQAVGIGDWRPKYGRFTAEELK